jgi:ribosomal-protein-alanine N-acetyltransferase
MKEFKTFKTDRLTLRPVAFEDAPFIFELMTSDKWIKFIGDRKIIELQDAHNYIESRMMPQLNKLGFGNYAVVRNEDEMLVGTVGLYDRDGFEGVDIGFAFLEIFERKGYALEASERLMRAAKEDFNLHLIKGITIEANDSSQKLLKKLGLEFIKFMRMEGDPEELMLFQKEI